MHGEKNALDEEESTIIMGALEMIEKKAEDAMTSIENAYMLEETTLLDAETIKQVPTRPSISPPLICIHKSNTNTGYQHRTLPRSSLPKRRSAGSGSSAHTSTCGYVPLLNGPAR
jgi:hypothetical protein